MTMILCLLWVEITSISIKWKKHIMLDQEIRGTTIVAVKRKKQVAVGGDGQVSLNQTVLKAMARKVRRLY